MKQKPTCKNKVAAWLAEHDPPRIEPQHIKQLLNDLAPIKEVTVRRFLRESQWPLAPLVEGVRQDNEDNLQRTLIALAHEYETNPTATRAAVLTARQHAEWNLRRNPADSHLTEAMLWIRTWLENPTIFETWSKLRRSQSNSQAMEP